MNIPTLNLFDGFLLVLTAASVFTACRHGLVKVVFSLSGLIFGVLVAGWMHSTVNNWLQPYITMQISGQILSFLVVVLVTYAIFAISGEFAGRMAKGAGLTLSDRVLGAGFGLLRAGLVGAIVLGTITMALPRSPLVQQSLFAPYLVAGTHAVSFVVPSEFRDQIDPQPSQPTPVSGDALEARTLAKR